MRTSEPFFIHVLKDTLSVRQKRNPAYSLRAFAKDLEIDSSNLSAVINRKRGLPQSRVSRIARKLQLPPIESNLFISSCLKKNTRIDSIKVREQAKKYLINDKYYKIISEWEYYGFLQLIDTKDFKSEISWISKRLGISPIRTQVIVSNLLELGFIQANAKNEFKRNCPALETSEDVESQALQKSHLDSLNLAIKKLETVPIENRDYSSITVSIDENKIPEAKAIIREFQDKLYALFSSGEKNEVYQLSCQLFPLTTQENIP